MNLWLTHFGGLLVGSALLWILPGAVLGWDPPFWVFPLWLIGSIVGSFPLHRALERAGTRALVRGLESAEPGADGFAVEIRFRDWVALASLAAPTGPTTAGERYRWSVGRSSEYLVALVTEPALRFWGGPPRSPHQMVDIAWADIEIDSATGQATVHRDGHSSISFRLHPVHGVRGVADSASLERVARLARLAHLPELDLEREATFDE